MSIVREVFSAGAKGYLLDMFSQEELLDALAKTVGSGCGVT
jgi:DNA-binding NarL/FixJ family response regulator